VPFNRGNTAGDLAGKQRRLGAIRELVVALREANVRMVLYLTPSTRAQSSSRRGTLRVTTDRAALVEDSRRAIGATPGNGSTSTRSCDRRNALVARLHAPSTLDSAN
jgi:hypothetical protein